MKVMTIVSIIALCGASLFGGDTAVLATAGSDITITEADLDEAIGSRLMRIRTEEYNVRRSVLDDLISAKLFEREAARRHITRDELFKLEVTDKIATPNRAEIEPVYEGIADHFPGMTKDEALEQIAAGMTKQRIAARRDELARQLRAAAGVKVNLQPPRVAVEAEGPSRGNPAAPVTIVEFSDFECPFCSRATATLRQIEERYPDRVRLVFRDYPLASHHTAKRAAEAARCAADQGKFWEMHDRMFAKGGGPVTDADINRAASQIGADPIAFAKCLDSGKYKDAWRPSQEAGYRAGVISTPTFFINGRMVIGAANLETFTKVIDEELANAPPPHATAAEARAN